MLTGLTLIAVATVRSGWSWRTGAVVLATGVFGWVYNLTDSGAVLEARSVHIGFGLLFSLGWVVLGVWLLRRALSEPQTAGRRLTSVNAHNANFWEFLF
jgi:hypothetical protein